MTIFNNMFGGGNGGGSATWGDISGDLNDQTDLKTALDGNANKDLDNITSIAKTNIMKASLGGLQTSTNQIGQIRVITAGTNAGISAPSGGTWMVLFKAQVDQNTGSLYLYDTDDKSIDNGALFAGGDVIISAKTGYSARAIVMRVQ